MGKEEFHQLKMVIREMEEEVHKENPSSRAIYDTDVRFHAVLTSVFANNLLESIGYYVDKITRQSRILTVEYILENGHQEEFVELHKEILDVLCKKDERLISAVIEKHYKYWEK